jgi:FRG domain
MTGFRNMAWMECDVEDWHHIIRTFADLDYGRPANPTRFYRGQSNAEWPLKDSLSRLFRPDVDPLVGRMIEQNLFRSFVAEAHLFVDPNSLPRRNSLLAWWSLMQHFRAPTRLLDWTASPYIALYFAVVTDWDVPGAVWAFNPDPVRETCDDEEIRSAYDLLEKSAETIEFFWGHFPPQFVYPFLMRTNHMRITTQQGRFTLCGNIPSDHGLEINRSLSKSDPGHCVRFIITKHLKPHFLNRLRAMNISANALFPGLDGLGKSLHELAALEFEYEIMRGFRGEFVLPHR